MEAPASSGTSFAVAAGNENENGGGGLWKKILENGTTCAGVRTSCQGSFRMARRFSWGTCRGKDNARDFLVGS